MPCPAIELALHAPSAPAFERAILDHLSRDIGVDAAFFVSKRRPGVPTTIGLSPSRLLAALAPGSAYERELVPVKRAALAARGVAVDTDVLGEARVRGSTYHRDLAAPEGGKHSLMAYLHLRGEVTGAVMLGRCGAPFQARDVQLMEDLLPSLTVARASFDAAPTADLHLLSAREREILAYLCLGYQNREIALACGTSPNTVRNQLASIFEKLGATTRAEAVAIARA